MNTATISFRVAPETKRRARALFSRLGISTSDAMNRILLETLSRGTIPAPVVADGNAEYEIPNEETCRVLERLDAGTEPLYGPFANVEEMFAALDAMPVE